MQLLDLELSPRYSYEEILNDRFSAESQERGEANGLSVIQSFATEYKSSEWTLLACGSTADIEDEAENAGVANAISSGDELLWQLDASDLSSQLGENHQSWWRFLSDMEEVRSVSLDWEGANGYSGGMDVALFCRTENVPVIVSRLCKAYADIVRVARN